MFLYSFVHELYAKPGNTKMQRNLYFGLVYLDTSELKIPWSYFMKQKFLMSLQENGKNHKFIFRYIKKKNNDPQKQLYHASQFNAYNYVL